MIQDWLMRQADIESDVAADSLQRWEKTLQHWLEGYMQDPPAILQNSLMPWDGTTPQTITLQAIEFQSVCSHHLLPFWGTAALSYVPDTHIISLGGARKVILALAQRLQLQELLTQQIADCFWEVLKPQALKIELTAQHGCQLWRGGQGNLTTKIER